MDTNGFDSLTRTVATTETRRGTLRLLVGSLLGGLLPLDDLAAEAKSNKHGGKDRSKPHGKDRKQGDTDRTTRVAGTNGKRNAKKGRCLAIGEKCPKTVKRGKKKRKLSCEQGCCTGYAVMGGHGTQRCACKPRGTACTSATAQHCCSQVCTGGVCGAGGPAAPVSPPPPQACSTTTPCPTGQVCCDGSCFTGICCSATDCQPDSNACVGHQCQCGSGSSCGGSTPTCCGSPGSCVNTQTDAAHCGSCDNPCPSSTPVCWNSGCVCGDVCASGCAFSSVQAAINAAEEGATVTLCAGTWTLTETVVIGKKLTLRGAGAGQSILDGGGRIRVLQIEPGAEVRLQDLTITKGHARDDAVPPFLGGGIFNEGTLTLNGVSVTGNTAVAHGGGIANLNGTVTLENSSVSDNAGSNGGGIDNDGGTLTLQANSHVTHNTARFEGGGILLQSGTMTLQAGSSVTRNTAGDTGGGISNRAGTVTLAAGSDVADNTAGSWGGGIINVRGTVTLQAESHVTGNTSTIGVGGGIYNIRGTVTVDASALVCNNRPPGNQCVNVANCPAPSETCPD